MRWTFSYTRQETDLKFTPSKKVLKELCARKVSVQDFSIVTRQLSLFRTAEEIAAAETLCSLAKIQ
jgi:hypothetical protein